MQAGDTAPSGDTAASTGLPGDPCTKPGAAKWTNGVAWPTLLWIGMIHVLAIGAFFTFTWWGFATFLVGYWLTGGLGVCLGFHRLLTHGSFSTFPWVKRGLALLGQMSGEGSAISWVAMHRMHHRFSDQPGDPHSPNNGAWWSHMIWLFPHRATGDMLEVVKRYAPDLTRDRVLVFLEKTFLLWHFLLGVSLLAVGYLIGGWEVGVSMLMWGMFARMAFVFHVTWFVNSATHLWGYRNYETTDESKNLWWVGLLAWGEGWHNNHHAHQRMAAHGHRWWEIDLTYYTIWLMERVGLAWNVVRRSSGPTAG